MLSCFRSPVPKRKTVFECLEAGEVKLLQHNWQQLCASRQVGQDILTSLISNKPIFASFFAIAGTQLEEMKRNERFLMQARRIESLLDTTVTSIGIVPEETIKQFSRNVGKIHFYHGVNFSSENWLFFECILKAELESLSSCKGWDVLVEMIVNEMKFGFSLEMNAQFGETESLQKSTLKKKIQKNSESSKNKLRQKEAALCLQSWNEANETEIGMKILLALITSKPAFANHFGVDPGLEIQEMREDPRIKIQASRIQGLLTTVVILYEAVPDSKIEQMCARIGETHFHKGVNFTASNWVLFKEVTIKQVIEATKKKSDEKIILLHRAWHSLMALVVLAMKDGFLRAADSYGPSRILAREVRGRKC